MKWWRKSSATEINTTKTRTSLFFLSSLSTMARTPSLTGVLHVNHEILLIVATIVILGVVILALVVASKRGAKVLQDPENQVNQNQGEIPEVSERFSMHRQKKARIQGMDPLQELVPRAEVVSRDQDLHRLMVWVNDLKCSLATQQELLDDLSNPRTFIATLDTLLRNKGREERAFQFTITATNKTKESCPAVKNQVLVGFAENFFPGVIINNGKVVALPEGEPCQRFRSVLCEGSQEGTQCPHCQSLSHFLSSKKYDYFNKGHLGPYTSFQKAAGKAAKTTPQLSQSVRGCVVAVLEEKK